MTKCRKFYSVQEPTTFLNSISSINVSHNGSNAPKTEHELYDSFAWLDQNGYQPNPGPTTNIPELLTLGEAIQFVQKFEERGPSDNQGSLATTYQRVITYCDRLIKETIVYLCLDKGWIITANVGWLGIRRSLPISLVLDIDFHWDSRFREVRFLEFPFKELLFYVVSDDSAVPFKEVPAILSKSDVKKAALDAQPLQTNREVSESARTLLDRDLLHLVPDDLPQTPKSFPYSHFAEKSPAAQEELALKLFERLSQNQRQRDERENSTSATKQPKRTNSKKRGGRTKQVHKVDEVFERRRREGIELGKLKNEASIIFNELEARPNHLEIPTIERRLRDQYREKSAWVPSKWNNDN